MSNYFNNNSSWNNQDPYYLNNTFDDVKFVYCPLCAGKAIVKSNKKNKKMLRCDLCRALMFANAEISQKYLLNLLEYREFY